MKSRLIFIFMFSYLLLLSQDNTFIRTYNLDGMNGGLALAVMNDGGFVGTGQHSDNGACRVYAYRIDECGNIIWFNLYNSGGGVAIDETFDNGVVIACDGGRILKIDSIGNPEWEKYYSSVGGYMTAIIQTSDSGYFAGGQSGQLLKLDNYGEVVWSASISGYNVHALDEFPNGDLMYFAWDNNSFFVGRVSPLGNLIWQNQYSSGSSGGDSHNDWAGEALIDKNLNRIIIASNSSHNSGDVLITSLDYNGGIIASNAFGSVSSSEFVRSIDLTDDGGYVIGGGTYGYNTTSTSLLTQVPGLNPENLSGRDILLFKVDPSLNFEWSSVIGCGGSEKAIGVRSNQDNGYSISAYTDGAFFSANYVDPLFIKTDSMGRVGCQQYSPVLTQTSISTSINTTNTLTFNSSVATTNSIVFNSISPTDYYMCLDCSTTPFFTISDTSLCVGDTTWFVNNSSGLICNQNWFVDGVLISGPADSVPFVFSSPGLHNIKLETSCGATYVDYEIDFYVNNLKLYVTNISDYNSYQISCYGYDDGFIETYATSPFPPVNYNWSTLNPSSSDQFNMYAGSYDLQLTDEFGCVFDTTFLLIEPTPLISSYAVSFMNGYNVTCNGGQDGYIDLTVNGSVPLYNYLWNNGNTTGNLNNLGAGEYYVTITDQNGCIATDTIEINEPILNIQENVTNVNCYGASNGSALVNVSGNTSPYYIFWGNNLNTSFLSAGIYSYQIVDSIGCIYNDSLIVSEPDSFVVVENITNVSCYGGSDGEISLNISGATPPYVVDWLGFSTTNMSAGTYNFTILDFNNCPYSEIAIVSEPNPIDVLNLVIDPTCNNTSDGSVSLQINGGTSPYLIDWGLNNPDSLAIGSYEFLVTDNNNCVDTNIVSLVSESNIVVNTNVSSVSCKGFCDGSVDLIIDGGVPPYAVNWFGLNAAFLCEGSVIFEVSDDLNCYYNQTIAISAPDSVDLQINQVGMFLEALASGGISPYSYQWFDGAGPISSNQTVSLANYGFYNCIVIDQNNCQSDTVSFNYTHLSVSEGVDNNIYIYPNPAENEFVIEFNTDSEIALEINLINVLGQYILLDMDDSFVGEYKHSIDISSMSKGVYFVSLKLDDKMINRKVIIK